MMNVGLCSQCQMGSKKRSVGALCEQCLSNTKRVPYSRKRYESEVSAKSGISALSAETQLTDIVGDEDDDLECDGPDSDYDTAVKDIQHPTCRNEPVFNLESTESVTTREYMPPFRENVRRNSVFSQHEGLPVYKSAQLESVQRSRQFAQTQRQRKRMPRMRKNLSESDSAGFTQRYLNRRPSVNDEYFGIREGSRCDSVITIDENDRNMAKVYVRARPVYVQSDPNLNRIDLRTENFYDSVKDNDSGYVKNMQIHNPVKLNGGQPQCEKTFQIPRKVKCVLLAVVVLAWAPVAVLTVLLLRSAHKEEKPGPEILASDSREIQDYVRQAIDQRFPGTSSNSAPLRLEGHGITEEIIQGYSHYRFRWTVASHFVQNPIMLTPGQTLIHVNQTGYYYIFCRIHFVGNNISAGRPFTVQHSLYKVNGSPNDQKLDSVSQHCLNMDDPHIEHTSTLETVVYLTAGSQIYIRIGSTTFIAKNDLSKNVMGIFLLPYVS